MGGTRTGVDGTDCVELPPEGGLYDTGGRFDAESLRSW